MKQRGSVIVPYVGILAMGLAIILAIFSLFEIYIGDRDFKHGLESGAKIVSENHMVATAYGVSTDPVMDKQIVFNSIKRETDSDNAIAVNSNAIKMKTTACANNSSCVTNNMTDTNFQPYSLTTVESKGVLEVLFPFMYSGQKNMNVHRDLVVRDKEYIASDIYLISDFSGSMAMDFFGTGMSRITALKKVVENLSNYVTQMNSNRGINDRSRLAFVGYSDVTQSLENGILNQYSYHNFLHQQSLLINNIRNDVSNPIRNNPKSVCFPYVRRIGSCRFYYNLDLTDQPNLNLNTINSFYPTGLTAAVNGIVEASRILFRQASHNHNQVFIIISDGNDSKRGDMGHRGPTDAFESLGFCGKLKTEISKLKDRKFNKSLTPTFYLININNRGRPDSGLVHCVDNNVYTPTNLNQFVNILKKIVENRFSEGTFNH